MFPPAESREEAYCHYPEVLFGYGCCIDLLPTPGNWDVVNCKVDN